MLGAPVVNNSQIFAVLISLGFRIDISERFFCTAWFQCRPLGRHVLPIVSSSSRSAFATPIIGNWPNTRAPRPS